MKWLRRPRALLTVVLGAAAVVAAGWATTAVIGFDSFAFAWVVQFAMMAWVSAALDAARPALTGAWFRVRPWEPEFYRWLGVARFGRLLRRIGWDRVVRARRGRRPSERAWSTFPGTRSGLSALDRSTRLSEVGHLVPAVTSVALAAVAAGLRAGHAAAWLIALTVVLHGYPILLQRTVRARIDRVRDTPVDCGSDIAPARTLD